MRANVLCYGRWLEVKEDPSRRRCLSDPLLVVPRHHFLQIPSIVGFEDDLDDDLDDDNPKSAPISATAAAILQPRSASPSPVTRKMAILISSAASGSGSIRKLSSCSPSPPPSASSSSKIAPKLLDAATSCGGLTTGSAQQESPAQIRRSSVLVRKGSSQSSPMKEAELEELFSVYKRLGYGRFGVMYSAEDRRTKTQLTLKVFNKQAVKQVDFIREYNYSYFLSPHPNIVDTYDGLYSSSDSYYFAQELLPSPSSPSSSTAMATMNLRDLVQQTGGLPDPVCQCVIAQIVGALEFMHNEGLVHRNLRAENVLVFNNAFTKVKLTDFGLTRKQGTLVKHLDAPNAYHAPELCDTLLNEAYSADRAVDVWSLGVLIYFVLRGRFPWTKASIMCKPYWEWEQWLKRKTPSLPPKWTRFTEMSLKLLKRTLNPKVKHRCTMKDVRKYIKGKWLKEVKSMSDDVLFLVDDAADMTTKMTNSMSSDAGTDRRHHHSKRRSVLAQWLATTVAAMTEISEQVVSASE